MSLLRDDTLTALNDLTVACRESVNQLETGADVLSGRPVGNSLRDLAARRARDADKLAEIVTKKDDVPNAPNEEREILNKAVTRLKAALSDDEVVQLLRDCLERETTVAEAAGSLIGLGVETSLERDLHDLTDRARTDIPAIAEAAGIDLGRQGHR